MFPELNENQMKVLRRELDNIVGDDNGYLAMDDLNSDAYIAQARLKKHIKEKLRKYLA